MFRFIQNTIYPVDILNLVASLFFFFLQTVAVEIND